MRNSLVAMSTRPAIALPWLVRLRWGYILCQVLLIYLAKPAASDEILKAFKKDTALQPAYFMNTLFDLNNSVKKC